MYRLSFALLTLALLPPPARGEAPVSQVTLPLTEYESLKKAQEKASVTVVDTLRLAGSFKGRDLSVVFVGRSAGLMPSQAVLAGAAGIVLYGCEGDGIVSRGEAGTFLLTPLAARFSVRCRMAARGSDRLELSSTPAVLWVESSVEDGEFVAGSESGDGGRSFSVVRRTTVAAEGLRPSATGRYRITLLPDETRFRFEIQVHNPNRSRRAFDVTLAGGEHVQQVDAPVPYDVQGNRYRFDLPPGETALVFSGSLDGAALRSPIDASVQYCVIESHPLLRPVVGGQPKRVSPQEVGIATEFRGAQAFLLGNGETLGWNVTRLEALRTTSFAVKSASHVFFLSADGPALGESHYNLDNQGAPDISLPMSAEPTFASLQDEPVLLTKDAQGHLWLPIAQGTQKVVVQYRQGFGRVPGFARALLTLPRLPVPATNAQVELRYPEDWFPLYEAFLSEVRIWTPEAGMVVGWLLLFVWTERVLALLGITRGPRSSVAAVVALAAVAWGWAAAIAIVADLAVTSVWVIPWIRRQEWGIGKALLAMGVAGFFLLVVLINVPMLLVSKRAVPASPPYEGYEKSLEDKRAAPVSSAEHAAVGGKLAEQTYQGLPARFQLPSGAYRTSFSREMLDTEAPRAARVLMISRTALAWLQSVLIVAALFALYRLRKDVMDGWRTRVAALKGEEKSPAHA